VSQPLIVALPPDLRLPGGYTFEITALDPTTGANVAGVTISDVHIQVEQTGGVVTGLPPVLLLPAGS
jgi:hypothetical protein